MVMDVEHDHHPLELLHLMSGMDIILAEGFKQSDLPKIEVFRPENSKPPACKGDSNLIAIISDAPLEWGAPRFSSNDLESVASFILQRLLQGFWDQTSAELPSVAEPGQLAKVIYSGVFNITKYMVTAV
jgi:hypothetical protein